MGLLLRPEPPSGRPPQPRPPLLSEIRSSHLFDTAASLFGFNLLGVQKGLEIPRLPVMQGFSFFLSFNPFWLSSAFICSGALSSEKVEGSFTFHFQVVVPVSTSILLFFFVTFPGGPPVFVSSRYLLFALLRKINRSQITLPPPRRDASSSYCWVFPPLPSGQTI